LLHGEAVNIDMSYMVYVARERGLMTEEEKLRIIGCMVGLELPVWHQDVTLALVQHSLCERLNHSGGLVRMPLPIGLGHAGKGDRNEFVNKSSAQRFVLNEYIFKDGVNDPVPLSICRDLQ
jgi:3-dehydroquinate synthetase